MRHIASLADTSLRCSTRRPTKRLTMPSVLLYTVRAGHDNVISGKGNCYCNLRSHLHLAVSSVTTFTSKHEGQYAVLHASQESHVQQYPAVTHWDNCCAYLCSFNNLTLLRCRVKEDIWHACYTRTDATWRDE